MRKGTVLAILFVICASIAIALIVKYNGGFLYQGDNLKFRVDQDYKMEVDGPVQVLAISEKDFFVIRAVDGDAVYVSTKKVQPEGQPGAGKIYWSTGVITLNKGTYIVLNTGVLISTESLEDYHIKVIRTLGDKLVVSSLYVVVATFIFGMGMAYLLEKGYA